MDAQVFPSDNITFRACTENDVCAVLKQFEQDHSPHSMVVNMTIKEVLSKIHPDAYGIALLLACSNYQSKFKELCEQLILLKAPLIIDDHGNTALHVATRSAFQNVSKSLIQRESQNFDTVRALVNLQNDEGKTPLYYACKIGYSELAQLFFDYQADATIRIYDDNKTILHDVAYAGHEETINILIKVGKADVNAEDAYKRTPLFYAATAHIAKLLLQFQANIDHRDIDGYTPLHYACFKGKSEVVKELLKSGACVNDTSSINGQTPLHVSCRYGKPDIAKELINKGADISIVDSFGKTPQMYAALWPSNGFDMLFKN